ncbi:MAG: PAS domain S-box protein [Clostridia bacterium]|nr:PAS domain S-box protein [Clostridia bacterium]
MKLRVAVMATLINLIVCAVMLVSYAVIARNTQNELIEEELKVTCNLSAEIFEHSYNSTADRYEYLDALARSSALGDAYVAYLVDGDFVYRNFDYVDREYLTLLLTREARDQFVTQRNEGRITRIAVANYLDDGGLLCYSKPSAKLFSFTGGSFTLFVILILFAIFFQFIIIVRYVGRSDKLVRELMSVLEDFTEGRFSSRITSVNGFWPKLTAEYNAVLARVQDRVFRQARRNRVLGQMLNQMHNGLVTVDTQLRIQFATSNAGKLFGKDVKEAEGRTLAEIFDNEELEKAVSDQIASSDRSVWTTETEGHTPTGSVRPLRLYTSTMFSEGKCTGALIVIEDITEIKKLEQIRTDFAANVSHEMKTPLTSIKGFIETLQAGAIDRPELARKFLDIMMVEAERLTRLINDILSITKLESGGDNVEITRINLMDIIRHVTEQLLRPQAEAKNVKMIVNNMETPAYVMGNRDRVQQLVLNLIENGVKYNKEGGSVTVTVLQDERDINMIVADTGIGIKEEHLGRLFERFYRVDKGRSREMGGTGLGLAICKHIVNTMDGHIEVTSKYGEGTEFLVTLKKAPPEEHIPDTDPTEERT